MHVPVCDGAHVISPHSEGVAKLCHIGARLRMKRNVDSARLVEATWLQV